MTKGMIFQIWEAVSPHLETLKDMEALDPDALRICAKTPTGIVMGDRFDSDSEEEITNEQ